MNLCVLQDEERDGVLSASEDHPLPCLHTPRADAAIRSRPLSDLYPFYNQAERSRPTYLLSGCGAQVQPITTACPDENGFNGVNPSAWSSPVIGQPEGKPSRIMKLFSNSKKGAAPAQSSAAEQPSWPGLSGLGVVGSFKKLRSSVLQGIQSKGAESLSSSNQYLATGTSAGEEANGHVTEGQSVSNGNSADQNLVMSQCDSDFEDYYDDIDDEEGNADGLTRSTVFSRSIRRAYGAGRISLYDTGSGRLVGRSTSVTDERPSQSTNVNSQQEKTNETSNVKVLSRLSRSAENLHIFRAPFRRKAPVSGSSVPDEELQRPVGAHVATSIQRTASASSVDLQDHPLSQRRNPVKTKGPMLKLVGSVTDLTVRRRQTPSLSPTSPSLMSPLSRLHDDYSRRAPCPPASERRQRPTPVRARVLSVGHIPLVHPQPPDEVFHPVFGEPSETNGATSPGNSAPNESTAEAAAPEDKCDSTTPSQEETSPTLDQTDMTTLAATVRRTLYTKAENQYVCLFSAGKFG